MGSLDKNIQLMLEIFKAQFLVLHFSYYTLMTFVIMLSVILLSILMIVLSILKCDQASDVWQQVELASELKSDLRDTVDLAGSGFLISMQEKLNWFCLTGLITLVLLM